MVRTGGKGEGETGLGAIIGRNCSGGGWGYGVWGGGMGYGYGVWVWVWSTGYGYGVRSMGVSIAGIGGDI